MITKEQAQQLNLPNDSDTLLLIENALRWISENTKITVDTEHLENAQANVRLFISRYIEIMSLPIGISSESAGGLSQSFSSTEKKEQLAQLAEAVFGEDNVTLGLVTFVEARRRKW